LEGDIFIVDIIERFGKPAFGKVEGWSKNKMKEV
jgi:hypothetical protein